VLFEKGHTMKKKLMMLVLAMSRAVWAGKMVKQLMAQGFIQKKCPDLNLPLGKVTPKRNIYRR
jgi:hypothetical protein